MNKYYLIALNKEDESYHIIKFTTSGFLTDEELKALKEKYPSEEELILHLYSIGVIDDINIKLLISKRILDESNDELSRLSLLSYDGVTISGNHKPMSFSEIVNRNRRVSSHQLKPVNDPNLRRELKKAMNRISNNLASQKRVSVVKDGVDSRIVFK